MALNNPRNTVSYDGIRTEQTTYLIDGVTITADATKVGGSSAVNMAVTLSADKTVALAADGDSILGVLVLVEADGKCAVQDDGFAKFMAGASATVTAGSKIVGALGPSSAKGYIRNVAATTGSYVQGTATDALRGRHQIIDASVTTAVVVNLD